jgi:hypothetical protein
MIDTFPDSWQWDYRHQEVRFYAWRNSGLVMCRISREAIEDRYGNPQSPSACVQAAKKHFNDIADRFSDLLAQGRFEDDGSVLLRSTDWLV